VFIFYQDSGKEKRIETTLHISRMGVIILDRQRLEVLDRLAVNMIRRFASVHTRVVQTNPNLHLPSLFPLPLTTMC
jgi:hypothetical protein